MADAEGGGCFGFKKKTVVMTCIGLCCLALVIWTVLVTGGFPFITEEEKGLEKGLEGLEGLEVVEGQPVMDSAGMMCPLNFSLPLAQLPLVQLAQSWAGRNTSAPQRVSAKQIDRRGAAGEPLCKCLCQFNATTEEIFMALRAMRAKRRGGLRTSTTIRPQLKGGGGAGSLDGGDQ
jgi:hypothetical protein